MRGMALVAGAIAVGLVAGFWHAKYEFGRQEDYFRPLIDVRILGSAPKELEERFAKLEQRRGGPKVRVVNGEEFSFGLMGRDEKKRHEFIVKNEGSAPLVLELIRTTCKCTLSEIKKTTVAPGEQTTIALEWSTADLEESAERFEQSAIIRTNDVKKRRLNLVVRGRIVDDFRVLPYQLPLSQISASETTTVPIKILSYGKHPPEIASWKVDVPRHAELFDFTWKPLPADELKRYVGATSGLLGTLTIKPGLAIGPLHGKFIVHLKRDKGKEKVRPFELQVVGDFSLVAGGDFDRVHNLLDLGVVPSEHGRTARVFIFVKGPHREKVKLRVASRDPEDVLKVDLSGPTRLAGGRTYRYEAKIRIPPGADRVRRDGKVGNLGRIIFATENHPVTKEIRMYVRFSVL